MGTAADTAAPQEKAQGDAVGCSAALWAAAEMAAADAAFQRCSVAGLRQTDSPEDWRRYMAEVPNGALLGFLFFEIEIGTGIEIDSLRFDAP
jgi:hypothetical protein